MKKLYVLIALFTTGLAFASDDQPSVAPDQQPEKVVTKTESAVGQPETTVARQVAATSSFPGSKIVKKAYQEEIKRYKYLIKTAFDFAIIRFKVAVKEALELQDPENILEIQCDQAETNYDQATLPITLKTAKYIIPAYVLAKIIRGSIGLSRLGVYTTFAYLGIKMAPNTIQDFGK